MEVTIQSLRELEAEATRLLGVLPAQTGATLIALSGELGAGKTAFTKALAWALGVDETVASPTFVLERIYKLPEGKQFKRLVHIDAYRLESGRELAAVGFDEVMRDAGNLVVLEWPEKVFDALPVPAVCLTITTSEGDTRLFTYA